MNFLFISPNFPPSCAQFCQRLRQRGVTVLGVGDAPYDGLAPALREALTEYYRVSSLEDYDQVYRAAAYFIHKYGRLDRVDSLNEYWLGLDARLRLDFNLAVGTRPDQLGRLVDKSLMKQVFLDAGIPTAKQHVVGSKAQGRAFAEKVGWPVIVKPATGVGANGAKKLRGEQELDAFYSDLPAEPYVMEQFLSGDICTYDAILDENCEPLFESMNTYAPVIDAVAEDEDVCFCTAPRPDGPLQTLGRRTAKAFGAGSRFVHFEFIHLDRDCPGVGKAGDYAAMEVNMRPAGGHDPDMMNYAQSVDVYSIYAEMVTDGKRFFPEGQRFFCAYAARKDGRVYRRGEEEITARYGDRLVMREEMPPIDWPAMGRYVYMAKFETEAEAKDFFAFILEK